MSSVSAIEQAFTRISGAPARPGHSVRLLRDAQENYGAWMEAIRGAERVIHFENFIVADDMTGWIFAEALAARAEAGVKVRFLYDWLGSVSRGSRRLWAALREAGVEVRVFNPPSPLSPLWLRRNHRKTLTVDGRIGFVSGLCVSDAWRGEGQGGEPWRDTGLEIRGPAVADLDAAFAETWALAGPPLPISAILGPSPEAGPVPVRVVAGRPGQISTYRLDLLVAATVRRTLWLTDAYFVATAAYVQALSEAARDGVDVRLLVPGTSDVPFLQPVVQAGYRPLVEAGVRVFEWNGSMVHAKTAVADGQWSRVGSTNLNLTSWMTNWELDVVVEDHGFAAEMEAMYLQDLSHATEIVPGARRRSRSLRLSRPSVGVWPAAAVGAGRTARLAVAGSRSLARVETRSSVRIGLALLAIAALITVFPVLIVSPAVIMLVWLASALLRKAWQARQRRLARRNAAVRDFAPRGAIASGAGGGPGPELPPFRPERARTRRGP